MNTHGYRPVWGNSGTNHLRRARTHRQTHARTDTHFKVTSSPKKFVSSGSNSKMPDSENGWPPYAYSTANNRGSKFNNRDTSVSHIDYPFHRPASPCGKRRLACHFASAAMERIRIIGEGALMLEDNGVHLPNYTLSHTPAHPDCSQTAPRSQDSSGPRGAEAGKTIRSFIERPTNNGRKPLCVHRVCSRARGCSGAVNRFACP